MLFTIIVLLTAFLIEGIGSLISVIGLSALFAANPIIITLAIALDIGKVVSISFLYKNWKEINVLMKSYMLAASLVLMLITSSGAFGFLSGQFQKAIAGTNEQSVIVQSIIEEQGRLQKRKEDIDSQIAAVPETNVRGKTSLIRNFDQEVRRINSRLIEIDKKLPELKIEALKTNVEVGPIIYVAEAFHTTPEQAVKWVILTIIFVFDPFAVALLLAGNYLLAKLSREKEAKKTAEVYIPPVETVITPATPAVIETSVTEESESPSEELSQSVVNEVHTAELALEPIEQLPLQEQIIEPVQEQADELTPAVGSVQEQEIDPLVQDVIAPIVQVSQFPLLSQAEEKVSSNEREIITIEQLTTPRRSSLEDFDVKHGDVESDTEDRRSTKHIWDIYSRE